MIAIFPFGPQISERRVFRHHISDLAFFHQPFVVKRGSTFHSFGHFSRCLPINPKRRRSISNMCSNHVFTQPPTTMNPRTCPCSAEVSGTTGANPPPLLMP